MELGFIQPCRGDVLMLHGKVTMEDGSVPTRTVGIERFCGETTERVSSTNAKGEYIWRDRVDLRPSQTRMANTLEGGLFGGMTMDALPSSSCIIRAVLAGYQSNAIQIAGMNAFSNPALPTLVLSRRGAAPSLDTYSTAVPRNVAAPWGRAEKEIQRKNWPDAEKQLRDVVKAAPKFAVGWEMLGDVLQMSLKPADAQEAYQQAVTINPKLLPPYLMLARLKMADHDWEGTEKIAEALITADTKHEYPEGLVFQATARFQLKNLDGALTSVEEAIRQDKNHDVPLAEYIYGLVLEAKKEYDSARTHITRFLEMDPKSPLAAAARTRIENLGKPEATEAGAELEGATASIRLGRPTQAWVPGGTEALAKLAHLKSTPSAQDFFTEFCRAIAKEGTFGTSQGIPQYMETMRVFMAAAAALAQLGENHGNSTTVHQSLATPADRDRTSRILQAVGWKLTPSGSSFRVEPSDQAADGVKQRVLPALGVDEIAMQRALQDGKTFSFEVPSGEARLIGGDGWVDILKDRTVVGGIAAVFATDVRFAAAYAALGAMSGEAASAMFSGIGLRDLVTKDAAAAYRYGDAFEVVGRRIVTPGGKENEAIWQKLAGSKPSDAPAFFKVIFEKDQGRLAAFYWAIAHTDPARQELFLRHAERYYAWFRDSDELHEGIGHQTKGWQGSLFHDLPLDRDGNIRFPGGRRAWTASPAADGKILLDILSADALEALVPVAQLEEKRKAPLDEASARLLARHYSEWRSLFPMFERIPGLSGDDLAALEKFADATRRLAPAQQNVAMAEWHSLMELMMRGMENGRVSGAKAFRDICSGLARVDSRATDLLREMAGPGDLDQVVPDRLLQLSGPSRVAFDKVMVLQKVPKLSTAKAGAEMAAALSGVVYAASLDPDGLLVNEDARLLGKHQFAARGFFAEPSLAKSSQATGSHVIGGLMNFRAFAGGLAPGGKSTGLAVLPSATLETGTVPAAAEPVPTEAMFRADGRLVEVYATVTDSGGHFIDDLARDRFMILDQGKQPKIVAFEPRSSEVSVALLLDTTGSMLHALPALKNAALRLIEDLRPSDSVAVYSFDYSIHELQGFTTDKDSAKRAVLRTQAFGETALYDALTRVGRDLGGKTGKKVIVLFTDGNDNSSTLNADTAVMRAKATGVPVYTVAQGDALLHPELIKQLAAVSKATGGESFVIHEPHEIRAVFDKVSAELSHGYLLVFQPDPSDDRAWRNIEVGLQGVRGGKVRAREGYYPQ
jgi:VWFA-related protein